MAPKPNSEPVTPASMNVRYFDSRIASRMQTMNLHRVRVEKSSQAIKMIEKEIAKLQEARDEYQREHERIIAQMEAK